MKETCSSDQTNAVCFSTQGDAEMYFYGADAGVDQRFLMYLEAAIIYPVHGLLNVLNLSVFDSDGNQIGRVSDTTEVAGFENGHERPSSATSASNIEQESQFQNPGEDKGGLSWWSLSLIGVSVAAAFLGIVCIFILYRRCWARICDSFDVLQPPPEQGRQSRRGSRNRNSFNTKEVVPEQLNGQFNRTWYDDDYSSGCDKSSSSEATNFERGELEVTMNELGDTHVCTSAYCEVCGQNRQPRIKCIPTSVCEPEQLPAEASRNYFVKDTVAL